MNPSPNPNLLAVSTSTPTELVQNLQRLIDRRNLVASQWGQQGGPGGAQVALLPPNFVNDLPNYISPVGQTFEQMAQETVSAVLVELPSPTLTAPEYADAWAQYIKYPPRLYESMLSEAGKLLNRCENSRKEGNDAAATAIKQAYELVTRDAVRLNQRHLLDLQREGLAASNIHAQSLSQAAQVFGNSNENDRGQAALAETESANIIQQSQIDQVRIQQNDAALDIDEEFDRARRLQQSLPGGALNSIEIFQRSGRFFREDLQEAYERLWAVVIGMKATYAGFGTWVDQNPLPVSGQSVFDDLIQWVRNAVRIVDRTNLRDQEIVVPIVIDSRTEAAPPIFFPGGIAHITGKLENGKVDFEIGSELLPKGFNSFRILTVGLCYLTSVKYPVGADALSDQKNQLDRQLNETRRFPVDLTLPGYESYELPANFANPITPEIAAYGGALSIGYLEPMKFYPIGGVGEITADGNYMEAGGSQILYGSPIGKWSAAVKNSGVGLDGMVARFDELPLGYAGLIFEPVVPIEGIVLYLRLLARPL